MHSTTIPRIYISAIKKSSGKTTISLAINRILYKKGLKVQPFKKGPDFIDPMWQTQATNRACRNLDFFFLSEQQLIHYFADKSNGADIAVIEGNHGLFDDINIEGGTDNASLAKLLRAPVILIVDVREIGRSIVPMLLGFKNFDKLLNISGIILNKVQSLRQENRLKKAISLFVNIPVIGAIPDNSRISILQRHLGLSATIKDDKKEAIINHIAEYSEQFIDMDKIIKIAEKADRLNFKDINTDKERKMFNTKIGIAFDNAFNFYYKDNLEILENYGCTLKFFSPIHDTKLPEVDALYIGGGFPELFSQELEENSTIRKEIKYFIDNDMPIYAECGGLVYMSNSLKFNGRNNKMVSAIDLNVVFHRKPVGHGYTLIEPLPLSTEWLNKLNTIRGHEFHYASVYGDINNCAFSIKRGFGINGKCDGIIQNNLLASFTHIYGPSSNFFEQWLNFIDSHS